MLESLQLDFSLRLAGVPDVHGHLRQLVESHQMSQGEVIIVVSNSARVLASVVSEVTVLPVIEVNTRLDLAAYSQADAVSYRPCIDHDFYSACRLAAKIIAIGDKDLSQRLKQSRFSRSSQLIEADELYRRKFEGA